MHHPLCPLANWISLLTFFNRQNFSTNICFGVFRATEVVSLNNASPCYLPAKLTTVEADIHRLKSVTTTSRSNFSDLCTFQRGKSRQSCPRQLSVTHQLRQVCSLSYKAVFKMFIGFVWIEYSNFNRISVNDFSFEFLNFMTGVELSRRIKSWLICKFSSHNIAIT